MSAPLAASRPQKATKNHVQTRPNALESSPLGRLPNEVILHIAEFLSQASKLAFRRSCRHVYSVTATRHLSSASVCKAPDPADVRKPPWEVLELAYPNHLECYYCRDLHPMDKIHEYAYLEARSKGPCWKMHQKLRTATFIHPNFSSTVFRIVMKQYRQGKDCGKLLEFLAYRSGAVREGAQVKQVIATPKIVGESLLMRLQTAYVIPPEEPSQVYLLVRNLLKCPHTNKWTLDNRKVTARLFQRFANLETVPAGRQENIVSHHVSFVQLSFISVWSGSKDKGSYCLSQNGKILVPDCLLLILTCPLSLGLVELFVILEGERDKLTSHLGPNLRDLL